MTWPAMDHGPLSPSGRVSARTRRAYLRKVEEDFARAFPNGALPTGRPPPPGDAERAEQLRRAAAVLRDLAARGMKPRAHAKEAARLESEAARLEHGTGLTNGTRTHQRDGTHQRDEDSNGGRDTMKRRTRTPDTAERIIITICRIRERASTSEYAVGVRLWTAVYRLSEAWRKEKGEWPA